MKKVFSILLLGILIFNCIGYRLLSVYLENDANARLEMRLANNDYDESQLISVKAPADHLAYYNNSELFERVDGEIEINGIQYKYVKKRLYNDTLEFLCITNKEVMKLHSAKDDFFKLVDDLQRTAQDNKTSSHQNFSKNLLL